MVNPNLKEQDQAILEAFASAKHQVVTLSEIEAFVKLSDRQLRRRLRDLTDRKIVGTRKPGRDKLWWLETEVKEPITVQYPLFRLVRNRTSVQLLIAGVGIGIVAILLTMAVTVAFGYNIQPPLVSQQDLLRWSLLASMMAGGFLIAAVITAMTGWVFRYFGIDLTYIEQRLD